MQLTIYLTPSVPLSLGGVKGEGEEKERGAVVVMLQLPLLKGEL